MQWSPFRRHEFAATYFSAPRRGFERIRREIVFRDERYAVDADVTTAFDLEALSVTYTYWAHRAARSGVGLTLGASTLSMAASVTAVAEEGSVTATQVAETDVPVVLAGIQGRLAITNRLLADASIATLPRVTVDDYTGNALTGHARVEYRPLSWLGIGAGYHYFRLNVDVAQDALRGEFDSTIRGPEAYLRLAF